MGAGVGGKKRREAFEGVKRRIGRGAKVVEVIGGGRKGDRDSLYGRVLFRCFSVNWLL